jgi:hypothetical protein
MRINIFVDESKHFETGLLILGGFASEHTKHYLDHWISTRAKAIWHPGHREMKSSERDFGREYLSDGFLDQHTHEIVSVFGICAQYNYHKDSYDGYRDWLYALIWELQNTTLISSYDEIHLYIDRIKLLSDIKTLERVLKRDLRTIDPRISRVTLLGSVMSSSIQLADLITGYYKSSIRGFGSSDFDRVFGDVPRITNTKKP